MKFITKLGVTCATVAMMASSMGYAGTVTSSQLNDHYIGADGASSSTKDYTPNDATAHYDTHWMKVARTINGNQGSLTVTVNSNFVAHNTASSYKFGDLFIMDAAGYDLADACTDNKGNAAFGCNEYSEKRSSDPIIDTVKSSNNWEYAFDLGGGRDSSYADNVVKTGKLKELDQDKYEYSLKSTKSDREWQAIMVNDSAVDSVGNGTWGTNVSEKLLTMTFDISNSSLMGAAQLALRWQMTCANDIIEVVTNFGPTPVSEPKTFILMLLAGLGIIASRPKKSIKSSA